ncbi:MAG: glycosyltransferase family 39 protein [Methanobacteriota archaeon]
MKPEKILCVILLLQGLLLFTNLPDLPHYFWDDGINMELSWNLANGEMRLYSIIYPFIPHPPLFFAVVGFFLKIFGDEVIVLRSITAFQSILTTIFLYYTGKTLSGPKVGLTASLFYAIYSENIYWTRVGFANSQLMLLSIIALYFFIRGGELRILSYLSVSLALLTEFTAVALLISVLGILLVRGERREAFKAFYISISLPAITYILILFSTAGGALLFDLKYALERFAPTIVIFALTFGFIALIYSSRRRLGIFLRAYYDKLLVIAVKDIKFTFGKYSEWILRQSRFNLVILINLILAVRTLTPYSDDLLFKGYDIIFFDYYWIGILGLFLIKDVALLYFFTPLFLLTLAIGRTDHLILPAYPYFALGLSVLLLRVYSKLVEFFGTNRNRIVTLFILVYYPFAILFIYDVNSFVLGRGLEREDLEGLEEITKYLNANTQQDDVVLSTSHISRQINAQGTELFQGLAAEGISVSYFGRKLPASRFAYNSSYLTAKYIVLPEGVLDWIYKEESMTEFSTQLDKWPVGYRRGDFVFYRNPNLK